VLRRALWTALLLLAACGGSGGIAGNGLDGGRDATGDGAKADGRDGAVAESGPDVTGVPDAAPNHPADLAPDTAPGDAADGKADGADAPGVEVAGDAAAHGSDAPADQGADATPDADGPADRSADAVEAADAPAEPVSMACTAPGTCDPFDPAACGAQVCRVQQDGNTACVAAAATLKGAGASCTFTNECGDGLDCIQIGDDPGPTCQRTCPKGSLGFCGGEQRCTNFFVGCVQFCRPRDVPCDIYAQNCADTTRACAPTTDSETGERYTGCRPAGPGARGDRCDTAACAKGLICVREAGVSTCRQVCTGGDAGALPCTGAGETCSGLTSTYQITYCK
jgi:hypothetical protein